MKKVPSEAYVHKKQKKGSLCQGVAAQLTQTEAVIYALWADEGLTPLQVALRRGTSVGVVHRHLRSIKRKGYVLNMVHRVQNSETTCEPFLKDNKRKDTPVSDGTIRLHGQHFVIKILSKRSAYNVIRRSSNIQYLNDCTVKLHRESIEVIASSGLSFFGESADHATAKSMTFWTRLFHKLESHLGVILLKARSQNIRSVSAHYARIRCGMAQEALDAGDRVHVYGRDDGKLWFTIDDSFKLEESETVHPETGQRDMADVIEPHLNDWREHAEMWPQSDLQRAVQALMNGQSDVLLGMKGLVASQQGLSEAITGLVKGLTPPEQVVDPLDRHLTDYFG